MAEEAPPADAPTPGVAPSVSPGLLGWLVAHRTSLAFTTYQTGQLFLVGAHPNGSVSFNQQHFPGAMGLCWADGRLHLASRIQVWRLENILRAGEIAECAFDLALVPRATQLTGALDTHEIAMDADGALVLVATRHSCLAALDATHSFRALWRPPFVSALTAEDRCHLNGVAMADGRPAYVTAAARTDAAGGWRAHRTDGGVLIDVADGRVVLGGLSMPHSPRVTADGLLLLEAGRGRVLAVARDGSAREIAFCPGFLRGLALHDGHAIVTVSKPRGGTFEGLPLAGLLAARDIEPMCGVLIVRLDTGAVVEWIRLDGPVAELFDVVTLPGVVCPMAVGPFTDAMADTISIAD